MRRSLLITLLALLTVAAAQADTPTPLTLDRAASLAADIDADLVSARSDVASAERDLDRSKADPLALRLELLQAEQALAAAQAGLVSAEVAAGLELADAYTAALQADGSVALVAEELAIADVTLEAQQIRFEAGAATQLDVDRAANDREATLRDLADAEAGRDLAYAELASLVGQLPGLLAPLDPALLMLPDLDNALARAQERNAQLLAGRRSVELAAVRLEGLDNAFTARSEIESAQEALESAERRLTESVRTRDLSVRDSYNAVLSAQARVESARANLATAQADLAAQRTRLDAGTISPLGFAQSQLSFHNTETSLASAEHALYLALLRLEQSVAGS
jgi:outer membrane protein TolC